MQIEGLNVLSCFDGLSGGQLALVKAGIKVNTYYASEIDKYAIAVARYNFPDTCHLGDVRKIDTSELPKIDLMLAGSPCTDLSFAGKQKGLVEGEQSSLFFDWWDLVQELKPKYIFLENVRMRQEYKDKISETLGFEPVAINSALVSAQSRYRLYWFGIRDGDTYKAMPIEQPKDQGIVLRHILETDRSDGGTETHGTPKQIGTAVDVNGHDILKRVYSPDGKSPTINTMGGGNREPKIICGAYRGRSVDENGKGVAWKDTKPKQMLELRKDGKSNSVTSVQKDNVLTKDATYWRKLSPLECERLQTVPDGYTEFGMFHRKYPDISMSNEIKPVSNTQRYKMLGNGWTIDVIAHIMEGLR